MGTVVSLSLRDTTTEAATAETETQGRGAEAPLPSAETTQALARAIHVLQEADRVFSTYKPDSPMSRLRRGEISVEQTPPEMVEVLELCRQAREATNGWFDPWRMPGGVDPTGLVKGWAAARALAELERGGLVAAMINAGGDIAAFGEPEPGQAWRIGLRHPENEERLFAVVELHGAGAVATSGTYERGEHIIDPGSRQPARGLVSATVAGPDLAFADAYATGLLASGGEALERVGGIEGYSALVVTTEGKLLQTADFPAVLLSTEAEPVE